MRSRFPSFAFTLPAWVHRFIGEWKFPRVSSTCDRMLFAISLARENAVRGSGGPFGAAIFNLKSHELIAPGINLVLSARCSVLHAEIVAIMLAQKLTGSFDLGRRGLPPLELVTSTAPCAMCLGAIPWSGIRRLVCGGRDEDARAIGFDEGAKIRNWKAALARRGIETVTDVCRDEARSALRYYSTIGGKIYNSGGNRKPASAISGRKNRP